MIVVGTTLAAFVMENPDFWGSWMKNAEAIKESCNVKYFAAIEVDGRGLKPFLPFIRRLEEIGGEYWTYMLDDGRTTVSTANRLRHLTTGQNLVCDYCTSIPNCSHLLFMAADCMPPDDVMPKMLEMNHPVVAPNITTYCLKGEQTYIYPFPVMKGMASAACIFIQRDVFKRIRFRWENGVMTDDPCFHLDAKELLGIETHIRLDSFARHFPEHVPPVEERGNDMTVVRPRLI